VIPDRIHVPNGICVPNGMGSERDYKSRPYGFGVVWCRTGL
jgi:hypothetical protein